VLTSKDTAFAMAHMRAIEADRAPADRLFEDPYAKIFAAAGAHAQEGTQRFLDLPFMVDAIRLRARFIDDFVRDGLRESADQIVMLGAGFDARALRMPEIAEHGVRVFEIDFAEQLENKRAILAAASITIPSSVSHVACDFSGAFEDRLLANLAACGFRTNGKTLFVWEGVIAYLDAAAIDRSLRFMARAGGTGARVTFDFVPMVFDDDPAEARTARAGFTKFEQTSFDQIWRRYLPGDPSANASAICMGVAIV
jgi:methyltransferase (TIGR00027 family)